MLLSVADITYVIETHQRHLCAGTSPTLLTQYIFGAQLPQILELEIDVNDGHATSDSQDNYVTAGRFLQRKCDRCVLVKALQNFINARICYDR